ncbi:MAG: HD domain-containing protein [Anaerolineales bacterium]
MNWKYRVWQFWNSLVTKPSQDDLAQVRQVLPPELNALFLQLSPYEQVHSIRVMRFLEKEGQSDVDLLRAALLHDIGKTVYRLSRWERIWIVLVKAYGKISYNKYKNIPKSDIWKYAWWQRALVMAENHAQWGADLLEQYHAHQRLIWLVKHHQDEVLSENWEWGKKQLENLRRADDLC